MATSYAARVAGAGRVSGSGGGVAPAQPTTNGAVNGGGGPKPSAGPGGMRSTVGFNVANERLAFIGNVLVGYRVEVQVRDDVA
jgi:hypothetical protein